MFFKNFPQQYCCDQEECPEASLALLSVGEVVQVVAVPEESQADHGHHEQSEHQEGQHVHFPHLTPLQPKFNELKINCLFSSKDFSVASPNKSFKKRMFYKFLLPCGYDKVHDSKFVIVVFREEQEEIEDDFSNVETYF